jgi:hypothetical protein
MRTRLAFAALVSIVSVTAACGGSEPDPGDDEHYDCAQEPRGETFTVGLEKVSPGGVHVRIMQSVPAPPARGDNVLTIQLADSGGAPMAGANLSLVPFMPDHGHGTPVDAVVTESTTVVGQYEVAPVNLWMPGLWQLLVNVGSEQVIYAFCIPG